jgi:predicted permease
MVEAAGLTDALPLDRNRSWSVGVPSRSYAPGERPTAFAYVVSPGYVAAMGMALVHGRDLSDTDSAGSPRVVVISQSLARTLYGGEQALGRAVQIVSGDPHLIVGIVADVRQSSLHEAGASQMYLSHVQGVGLAADLVIRSRVDVSGLVAPIRQDLSAIDPALGVTEVRRLTDLVDRAVSPRRFLVSLLTGFSGFALLLASLGIYGVVSYSVSQRVQEIGVRMALGATAADVRRQVLAGTLRLAAVGIVVGLGASLALGRVIGSLLVDTSATDGTTFLWTALTLLIVAGAAGYVPALRASRIGPMRALQQ